MKVSTPLEFPRRYGILLQSSRGRAYLEAAIVPLPAYMPRIYFTPSFAGPCLWLKRQHILYGHLPRRGIRYVDEIDKTRALLRYQVLEEVVLGDFTDSYDQLVSALFESFSGLWW